MISGVVLAAGEGRRFGGTKQLAVVDGKPLVQHAIDALAGADVSEIVVVTGHDAEAVEAAIELPSVGRSTRNPAFHQGQATSLAHAIDDLADDSEAAVILLADQPGITADEIGALIASFDRTRPRVARLRFLDGPGPSLLSSEIYSEARKLQGDAGARTLLADHPEWVEEVMVERAAPRDIDSPDDLV